MSIKADSEVLFGRHVCPFVKGRVAMGSEVSALIQLLKWNRFLGKYTRQCFVRA